MEATSKTNKKSSFKVSKRKKLLFYILFISIPVAHFLIFNIYINFNSILMAFKTYEVKAGVGLVSSFAGFKNFSEAWKVIFGFRYRITNSLLYTGINILVTTPLVLLFSFYIYKKRFGSKFFKVMLFMTQLLSEVILGILFKYFMDTLVPYIYNKITGETIMGLLASTDTQYFATILFNIFMGFGVNVLIYSSTMSGIDPSLIESAELDGATHLQEFRYIVFPLIYPTFVTLFAIILSVTFTEQFRMYTLYQNKADRLSNLGYYLYMQAKEGDLFRIDEYHLSYPELSAMGLILTAIIVPIVFTVRKLLNKYGPRAD